MKIRDQRELKSRNALGSEHQTLDKNIGGDSQRVEGAKQEREKTVFLPDHRRKRGAVGLGKGKKG